MTRAIVASMFVLLASNVYAQQTTLDTLTPALPTVGERHAAEIASNVTVAAALALDAWHAWKAENRTDALVKMGVRLGVTQGATFALKKLLHRERPCAAYGCGTDNPDYSLPSGHTATTFATVGGARLAFSLPLSVGTGGLRIAAGKHWLTDTLAGAGIGLLAGRIR